MNYDRIILELMDRVSRLEREVANLKKEETIAAAPADNVPTVRIGRDTTKYFLDGVKYGKSRLALAIVQKYCNEHPGISAADLMGAFDRSIQGSLGVIRRLDDVTGYSLYERRFFCNTNEIISIDGVNYVVCSQWSSANINNMITRAKEHGMNITVITIGGTTV